MCMTIGMYEIQGWSANLCDSAHEALFQPDIESKVELIGDLVLARLASFCAAARAVTESISRLVLRFCKAGIVPLVCDFSANGFLRALVGVALSVTLIAVRILSSIAGVVCPELVFGVLRLHRSLLWWGLFNRAQQLNLNLIVRADFRAALHRLDLQNIRQQTLHYAIDRIDQREWRGEEVSHEMFSNSIWNPAFRQAFREECDRVFGHDAGAPHDGGAAAVPPPGGGAAVDGFAPLGADFWAPVHVGHPVLETFQSALVGAIHEEAVAVRQEGLYTKDEVEDMVTAYQAIINRAVLKVIEKGFRMEEIEHWWGKESSLVLADGRAVEGQSAGGLEEWKDKLIEIKQLLRATGRTDHLTDDERALLPLYLCADLDRCRTVRQDLPELSTLPRVDRCFKLIGEFATTFVSRHLPPNGEALGRAFALPDEE